MALFNPKKGEKKPVKKPAKKPATTKRKKGGGLGIRGGRGVPTGGLRAFKEDEGPEALESLRASARAGGGRSK